MRRVLRFPLARLTVDGVRPYIQRRLHGARDGVYGVHRSVVGVVGLSTSTRFPISDLSSYLFVVFRGVYLSQRSIREELLRSARVPSSSRTRVGDAKGKHYDRYGSVRVLLWLLSFFLVHGSGPLFLVGSRRTGVFRLCIFKGSSIHSGSRVRLAFFRVFSYLLLLYQNPRSTRRFRACQGFLRPLRGNVVGLLHGSHYEYGVDCLSTLLCFLGYNA